MLKWQLAYLDEISKMSNEEVLDEYTYYFGGDDYDGCLTRQGEWKFKKITNELMERLKKCGFINK